MSRKPYPGWFADAQWEMVRSAMPAAKRGRTGKPRQYPWREIWNAIFDQAKNGCTWRALPNNPPPWPAVWQQYRRWRDNGTMEAVHATMRDQVRRNAGLGHNRGRLCQLEQAGIGEGRTWGVGGRLPRSFPTHPGCDLPCRKAVLQGISHSWSEMLSPQRLDATVH